MAAQRFTDECAKRGVLSDATGPRRMRFVTHYGIDAGDIQTALKVCEDVLTA
jgi:acetylornithine/succinyldiaminopimelate/putrescine aminotransferase